MKATTKLMLCYIASAVLLLTACTGSSQNEHQHTFGKWSITKEASCTETGTQSRTCEDCGYTETETFPKLDHTVVIDPKQDATCFTPGKLAGSHCSLCNEIITAQKDIPASHKYSEGNIVKQPTCVETGEVEHICSACGDTKIETLPTIEHTYDEALTVIIKAATCTEKGEEECTCSICGQKNVVSVYALGHDFNDNNICTRCNEKDEVTIALTPTEKASAEKVEWISERQVWYQEYEKRFVLVFSLLDENKNELSVPVIVDVRIENDEGETVYSAVKKVHASDYLELSYNNGATKKLQATVYINADEIAPGKIDTGNIFFTVYNDYVNFSESQETITGNLPLKETTIILPELPQIVHSYDWREEIDYSFNITNITYEIDGNDMRLYFTGEKIFDAEGPKHGDACRVSWRLYDSEGYVIESGTFYSPNLYTGEKFKNERDVAYDCIERGETYTLAISSTIE